MRVGLVGAGPWARLFTAPLLARGPECALDAVWARRREQAEAVAGDHGAVVAGSFEELVDRCEAVAFAVPPDVQADLATRAATAGRAVLLDKPIALTLDDAERLTDAVTGTGVVSQVVLTNRYRPSMRAFLGEVVDFAAVAARATFLGSGAVPGDYFATPWRLERGAPLDLGPHVLDALDAVLGPIVEVDAAGDRLGVVALTCRHDRGAVSQATLSATTPVEGSGLTVELFGPRGRLTLDTGATDASDRGRDIRAAMATIAAEFAGAVRTGVTHPLDVRRGLHLQRLLAAVEADLGR